MRKQGGGFKLSSSGSTVNRAMKYSSNVYHTATWHLEKLAKLFSSVKLSSSCNTFDRAIIARSWIVIQLLLVTGRKWHLQLSYFNSGRTYIIRDSTPAAVCH